MKTDILIAIVFPGQASQKIGMLLDLSKSYSLVKDTFDEASEILGYNAWKLVQNGPVEKLNATYYTQPILLISSVAIWRIWKAQGGYTPKIMAGHSLGEYTALVCAGSINFSDAIKLVMMRGMFMQEIVPYEKGAMSVIIGLSDAIIQKLCKISEQGQVVAPACFNSPGYVVISGHKEAVIRTNVLCKKEGAKYVNILPISVPSHCILMKAAVSKLKKELEKIVIHSPVIPIINNTDVCIEYNPQNIRNALLRQLYTPVRWSEIVQYLINEKIHIFLEMGPKKILTKLIRNIVDNRALVLSINDTISLSTALRIKSD